MHAAIVSFFGFCSLFRLLGKRAHSLEPCTLQHASLDAKRHAWRWTSERQAKEALSKDDQRKRRGRRTEAPVSDAGGELVQEHDARHAHRSSACGSCALR
jgi:hypothetical protein